MSHVIYPVDLGRLSDGVYGPFGTYSQYTVMPNNVTLTFTFDTIATPPWVFRTFASWDDGRDGQAYTVKYSTVDDPLTFLTLVTISTFNNTDFPNTSIRYEWDEQSKRYIEVERIDASVSNTLVELSATDGFLATNVAALQFVFTGHENGGTAYREFDVFGVAVPEPATAAALLGVIALGAAAARRRR